MAACLVNAKLADVFQTTYIPPKQEHIHISSSVVRDLINLGSQMAVLDMVPGSVYRYIGKIMGWQIP